jgi:hypothetical protein
LSSQIHYKDVESSSECTKMHAPFSKIFRGIPETGRRVTYIGNGEGRKGRDGGKENGTEH